MAVTWVGGAGNHSATTFAVTLPAASLPGDLAVLITGGDSGTDPGFATPAGWTLAGKIAATNTYSYIWYRTLQAGDTSVSLNISGVAGVGVWRNAAWAGMGTFGTRGAVSSYSTTAPNVESASGVRLHLFVERSTASTAGEVDVLPTLTYGTARYFYPGDLTLGTASRIALPYFCDSLIGSGDNTATFIDNSTNSWGVQVAITDLSLPKVETLKDTFDTSLDKVTKWPATSTATVWDASGQAKIPIVANYWNLGTSAGYDLTDSYLFAKVTPTTGGTKETFMEVIQTGGANNYKLSLFCSGTDIGARRTLNGAASGQATAIPYNATNHAWWRIRESGGTTYFEVSPDATTWTLLYSVANGFDVTHVWVNFSSGFWSSDATGTNTLIDNVNTVPVSTGRPKTNVVGTWTKKPAKLWGSDATAGLSAFGLATGPSTKTATVTVPAGVTVGSLLLLTVTVTTGNIENWNTAVLSGGAGSGWTLLPSPTGTSGCNMFLWWKIATAGDPGSVVTYTAGAAGVASGVVAGVCEVKSALFHGADFYYNAGANQGSAAGMAGVPTGRQIVCAMGVRGSTNVGTGMIVPTGWTVISSTNTNAWASAKYYVMFAIRDAVVSDTVAAVTGAPGFDDDSGATFNRVSWSVFTNTGKWIEKPMKKHNGTAWVPLT